MRRTLVLVGVGLVIVIGVIFAIASSNLDRYRPQIQHQIQAKLNRPVQLGHLGLRLFPFSVKVENLVIQEDPSFQSSQPFASAADVGVSVGLFSLLRGQPDISSLTLNQPHIELIRNSKGVWNYSTLGGKTPSPSSQSSSEFSINELKINDGRVAYTDQLSKQESAVYDHIDLTLRNFSREKPFSLNVGAHLPGQGKQQLTFDGNVGPINGQTAAATPIHGHLTADQLSLSAINRFAPGTLPSDADAVLTAAADVSSQGSNVSCKGDLKLTDTVVRGSKLDFPIASKYDLTLDRAADTLQVRSTSVGLAGTSFDLNGNAQFASKPGNLNMHVVTANSSIAELARLAAAFGVAFNPAYKVAGTLTTDLTASGPTSDPRLNGSLSARNLQISGGEVKKPVTVPALDLKFTPDTAQSNNFTAQSGPTTLQVQVASSNYASPDRTINATLQTNNADIADLIDMAKAYGFDEMQGATAAGRLSLSVRVQGQPAHASALTFAGNGTVSEASITTPRLTKTIGIRTAKVQFAQNRVAITDLNSSIGSTNLTGNVSANNFSAPKLQFALAADKIDTDELSHLSKTTSSASSAPSARKPASQPGLLEKTTGSGTLSAGSIKAQNLLITNVRTTCKLDNGVIQLSPLTAVLYGGNESGTITLNTRSQDPAVSVKAKLSGVDSNALLSAVSSVRDTLYGKLASDANLTFTLEQGPSNNLARTLNGTLGFNLADGQLRNVNILNEVSKIGKFLRPAAPAQTTNATSLRKLSGTLDIKNGLASTSNLAAALDAGSLSANGLINLVDQALNLHVTAVLSSGVSQSAGGSGVGGYLNTALANNKGELVLPMLVTGTTAHPTFSPDVEGLAKMKLNNLLPTASDPTKLTSGVIGAVTGKQGTSGILNQVLGGKAKGTQQPAANQPAQDPVNSILQQFGKKKPKQ